MLLVVERAREALGRFDHESVDARRLRAALEAVFEEWCLGLTRGPGGIDEDARKVLLKYVRRRLELAG